MNNFNVTGINGIRVDKEIVCDPLSLVYFMLFIVKSFQIFSKQNSYSFILESFALA